MQCRKSILGAFFVAMVSISALPVFAQKVSAENELQGIGERTAVLEARLKELELENKVLLQNNELVSRGVAAKRAASTVDSEVDYGTPAVVLVEGRKGALEALLVYRGNVHQRVREGDKIFGSMVKKISVTEVVLMDIKSRSTQRLQFSSDPIVKEQSSMTSGLHGSMPPGVFPTSPMPINAPR